MDLTYSENFVYRHRNPYHDRLAEFDDFVLRDHEAEAYRGHWNQRVFDRDAPLFLEIGTGYGHFMVEYCEHHPEVNFVGLDYRFKRSFNLAKKLSKHPNKNFRYLRGRGERSHFLFGENELDGIFYFFPDPWPKKRHHKKRLFQRPFLESVYKVLKPGAKLYVKTDHDGYAEWMREVIAESSDLFRAKLISSDLRGEYPDHFLAGFQTKFEKIFISKGIPIKAFVLESLKAEECDGA